MGIYRGFKVARCSLARELIRWRLLRKPFLKYARKHRRYTFSFPAGCFREISKAEKSFSPATVLGGNKWCHATRWMCLFPKVRRGLWKRRKATISPVTSPSATLPRFRFFLSLSSGVVPGCRVSPFSGAPWNIERSCSYRTKRQETLPTVGFKAIYGLIGRRSEWRAKRYRPVYRVYQEAWAKLFEARSMDFNGRRSHCERVLDNDSSSSSDRTNEFTISAPNIICDIQCTHKVPWNYGI